MSLCSCPQSSEGCGAGSWLDKRQRVPRFQGPALAPTSRHGPAAHRRPPSRLQAMPQSSEERLRNRPPASPLVPGEGQPVWPRPSKTRAILPAEPQPVCCTSSCLLLWILLHQPGPGVWLPASQHWGPPVPPARGWVRSYPLLLGLLWGGS